MTAHGFRAPASSILNESGSWNPDATEAQLAHVDTNATRGLCASAVLGGAHSDDALSGGGPTGRIQVRCCLTVVNRSRANRAEARSWLAAFAGRRCSKRITPAGVRLPSHKRYEIGAMHFHPLSTSDMRPPPWTPKLVDRQSDWWGHVPFAFWLTEASKPRILVELGTHHGVSYAAFCEAVTRSDLATRCYAVDSWIYGDRAGVSGDEVYKNLKIFHDENYATFSELVRSDFDSACGQFADASIDLLHIDGLHTYEAVCHDFETWRPKLTDRGIVLVHCTNVRADEFGVWRFFGQASKSFPNFEFLHSRGLGVLAVGPEAPEAVKRLCELSNGADVASVREAFSNWGSPWVRANEARAERDAPGDRVLEIRRAGAEDHAAVSRLSGERDVLSAERDNLKKTLVAMQSQNEAQRAANTHSLKRIALLQNEHDALRAALDTSERLVAYVSELYRSAVRKRKLRSLKRRLWLAVRKLPVRRQAYEAISDSSLFEKNFYLSSNPDVRASAMAVLKTDDQGTRTEKTKLSMRQRCGSCLRKRIRGRGTLPSWTQISIRRLFQFYYRPTILRPVFSKKLLILSLSKSSDTGADVIYTDHINIRENGEPINVALKPSWSPEFFLSINYIVHFKIFRRSL
jgi:hypothetical protein